MATLFLHRLSVIVPAARRAVFLAWWRANIDADETLDVELNPAGDAGTATAYWLSTALKNADTIKIIRQLAQMASLTLPPAGSTRAQVKQWLVDNRAAIVAVVGLYARISDNDGVWHDHEAELTGAGVQRVRIII